MSAEGGNPLAGLYPETLDCVHCGLCLSSCPTYRATGRETSSPRGRVALMRAVAEGRIELGDTVVEEAHLCLGCRACETACPSGVRYGAMLETTREEIEQRGLRRGPARSLERLALRHVVPHPQRLRGLVDLLRLAQRLRLDRLALAFLPRSLRESHALLPALAPRNERTRLPTMTPAVGLRRGRVALFESCVMPELFGRANRAAVRVLAHAGFEVVVPAGQGCCGALLAHAGDAEPAHALARRNLQAFDPRDVDAIVTTSAGCGAALREADRWLGEEAAPFAGRVRDVCEVLDDSELPVYGRVEGTVCYDDPCHLIHAQGVAEAPRRLLERVPGLELLAHDEPGSCCGAAGIYNVTHGEMSRTVLARKMSALAEADPDWIASGNPGCLMQLAAGARGAGLRAEVVHPVELLARALPPSHGPG